MDNTTPQIITGAWSGGDRQKILRNQLFFGFFLLCRIFPLFSSSSKFLCGFLFDASDAPAEDVRSLSTSTTPFVFPYFAARFTGQTS